MVARPGIEPGTRGFSVPPRNFIALILLTILSRTTTTICRVTSMNVFPKYAYLPQALYSILQ